MTDLHLHQKLDIRLLSLSRQYQGKRIPFLGDEPFKFLGRKMSSKKNGLTRAAIKENFIGNLEITSKANIIGPYESLAP